MLVKVEDFVLDEVHFREFAVANFVELERQLGLARKYLAVPIRVLVYSRSRFIEVWSDDGQRLMARYTPTAN